jgi:hypothetical protein
VCGGRTRCGGGRRSTPTLKSQRARWKGVMSRLAIGRPLFDDDVAVLSPVLLDHGVALPGLSASAAVSSPFGRNLVCKSYPNPDPDLSSLSRHVNVVADIPTLLHMKALVLDSGRAHWLVWSDS